MHLFRLYLAILIITLSPMIAQTAHSEERHGAPDDSDSYVLGEEEYVDLEEIMDEIDILPENYLKSEYQRGRMAFLFGQYQFAYNVWLPLAEQGYAKAQANLGWMYQTGKGAKKDLRTALAWYRKAARQNHTIAQNNVGVMYEQGLGTRKNLHRAVKWYREAAELGYAYAQYNLGMLYQQGKGIAKDSEEAQFWLQIAALQGVKQATQALDVIQKKAHSGIKKSLRTVSSKPFKHPDTTKPSPHQQKPAKQTKQSVRPVTKTSQKPVPGKKPTLAANNQTRKHAANTQSKTQKPSTQSAKSGNADGKPKVKDWVPKPVLNKWFDDARQAEVNLSKPPERKTNSHRMKLLNMEWLKEQNPKQYTLELANSNKLEWIINIAKFNPMLEDTAYYTAINQGTLQHFLVYGRYGSQRDAKKALRELPATLKKWSPKVRKISDIQAHIQAYEAAYN